MSRALWILLALPLLLVAPLSAQSESQAIRAFKMGFATSAKKPVPIAERAAALDHLVDQDSAKVAEVLVAAYKTLEAEIEELEAARLAMVEEMRELIAGQEHERNRRLPREKFDRHNELRRLSEENRTELDARRALQEDVATCILSIGSADGLEWLVTKALRDQKVPLLLRLHIAQNAGSLEERLVPELVGALRRARRPGETIAILDGLGRAGPLAREAVDDVIKLLSSRDEAVRERASLALAHMAAPEAIEPMIDLLARETGQARKRLAGALEILTGQELGTAVASWRAWWAAEGASVLAGEQELGVGKPSRRADEERGYYFGIPQDGRALCYVIDASGSMQKQIEAKLPGTRSADTMSRLEGCKAELIAALGRLKPDQKFNLIWYSDLPHLYQPKMQKASPKVIAAAQAWVRDLKPAGSTNIHDSLQTAFTLAGQGVKDRFYGVELDTIFLLSDGSPTKPDGTLDSTETILVAVRAWNPLQRVTIHTIGIGRELNGAFLNQLARENGGEFKRY